MLLTGAAFAPVAFGQSSWLVDLPTYGVAKISQGDKECVPASLFNMFQLGTPQMQQAIRSLPGDSVEARYQFFLREYLSRPTLNHPKSKTRFSSDWGMHTLDLQPLALELLPDSQLFQFGLPKRVAQESDLAFSERVHSQIVRSLRRKVPVIMSVSLRLNGQLIDLAHAVTITSVSHMNSTGDFYVGIVDASGLESQQILSARENKEYLSQTGLVETESLDENGRVVKSTQPFERSLTFLFGAF